ncbi:hypothetical protein AZE42_06895 [Rhizopogon vesiculosus]|uniref:Uncharacterized protein n=1 Tax=Rhizopogon vesiculosus TaxID=180088 RepID=A0A1J8QPH6_9AGAM|nr:hypothetical protein AZE42_06895 [Rhizopogon vesiculosus]
MGEQPVYGTSSRKTEPVTVHRHSSFSPVRLDSSRESSLPMMSSLSPERTRPLNTSSIGTARLLNDSVSEATALYSREDDAGTLIPPDDAPRGRLPPAYNLSWVSRNRPPRSSTDDPSSLNQNIQTVHRDTTRPARGNLPEIPQEKRNSRWSSDS